MLKFILDNPTIISHIIAIVTGAFVVCKWLDTRKREIKNQRYSQYIGILDIINNADKRGFEKQIFCMWLLFEYKEYYDITLKIFDNEKLMNLYSGDNKDILLDEIKLVVIKIKQSIDPQYYSCKKNV